MFIIEDKIITNPLCDLMFHKMFLAAFNRARISFLWIALLFICICIQQPSHFRENAGINIISLLKTDLFIKAALMHTSGLNQVLSSYL